MNPTLDNMLSGYLAAVSRASGADAVSLCLPVEGMQPWPRLFHHGAGEPVPEFLDSERAREFLIDPRQDHAKPDSAMWFHRSEAGSCFLIGMDLEALQRSVQALPAPVPERREAGSRISRPGQRVWLGLRYNHETFPDPVEWLLQEGECRFEDPPENGGAWLASTVSTGALMAWEACRLALLRQDSITGLPGRSEFRACLEREFQRAQEQESCLGLMLVNPDEFGVVNHRLGQETGDRALSEIAARMHANLRRSDQIFRFGGAIFAVVMSGVCSASLRAVTEKLRRVLTQAPYVDGGAHFSFSIGAVAHDPRKQHQKPHADANEMLRRADQALNMVKLSGGSRSLIWDGEGKDAAAGNLDRLSGIFTADTEKDYRNMLLLWETITVISSWSDMQAIAREFVDRIGASLKPERAALFVRTEEQQRELVAVSLVQPDQADRTSDVERLRPDQRQLRLIEEAEESGRTQRLRLSDGSDKSGSVAFAVPLLSQRRCMGVLYLDGRQGVLRLDTSDLVFLDALASQIGILLDRARLAERWRQEKVRESQRLRREVQALRKAMQRTRMIYHSPQMQSVMETIGKAAPTDVTVLIMGESGTGKEMLARAVHQASSRNEKPFVTVDCSAIAHSLIDSELFGHVRGAFTGAGNTSRGRIQAANGGTLFLDEVGELPLDIQAKLLRLIQEKEITPVGATDPVKVDVRIIAATNRDLAEEVAAGGFRSDLYYRLQVVTVIAPPLRDRPQDILPLARYFLQQYEMDYSGRQLSFSEGAERLMLSHPWPGNVRELQNRILQAVITAEGDFIGEEDLRLSVQKQAPAGGREAVLEFASVTQPRSAADDSLHGTGRDNDPGTEPVLQCRERLSLLLKEQVRETLAGDGLPSPLGRWLEDDLVMLAADAAGNNLRRAARQAGMAETTFRRRMEKVQREQAQGGMVRNDGWSRVRVLLSEMVQANQGEDLLEQLRVLLLEEVRLQVEDNARLGAALMGVTVPTYRRWSSSKLQEAV